MVAAEPGSGVIRMSGECFRLYNENAQIFRECAIGGSTDVDGKEKE